MLACKDTREGQKTYTYIDPVPSFTLRQIQCFRLSISLNNWLMASPITEVPSGPGKCKSCHEDMGITWGLRRGKQCHKPTMTSMTGHGLYHLSKSSYGDFTGWFMIVLPTLYEDCMGWYPWDFSKNLPWEHLSEQTVGVVLQENQEPCFHHEIDPGLLLMLCPIGKMPEGPVTGIPSASSFTIIYHHLPPFTCC